MEIKQDELLMLAIEGLRARLECYTERKLIADKKVTLYSGSAVQHDKFQKALEVRKKYEKLIEETDRKINDILFYYDIDELDITIGE